MAEIVAVSSAELLADAALLDAVAEVFAKGFQQDPGMRYIAGEDAAQVEKQLLAYFRGSLPIYANPLWMLRENGRYIGGAVLSQSDHIPDWRLGVRAAWIFIRQGSLGLLTRAMNYGRCLEPYQPEGLYLTLDYLALIPEVHGKGYGRQLLDHVAQIAQETPNITGVWLDSPNPVNVPMYEHFGYEKQHDVEISATVGTTTMFRPQPGTR